MSEKPLSAPSETKTSLLNNPTFRSVTFQVVMVLAVVAFFVYIANNTLNNMAQRGISTGFGFLDQKAGFGILMSLIEYDADHTYGRTFFVGLLNTLLVSFLGIVVATILGFIIGVARLSANWLIARIAAAYIEIFRNIPLLLQILFWYFAVLSALPSPRQSLSIFGVGYLNVRGLYLPAPVPEPGMLAVGVGFVLGLVAAVFVTRWAHKRQERTGQQFPVFYTGVGLIIGLPLLVFAATGFPLGWDMPVLKGFNFRGGLPVIPELVALVLALSIYTAAFIAEIVRAGILAVSHGQTEAARALGLRPNLTLRLVVIPQAMRVIIPPLTSQYLNLAKNSSLATAVGYPDLVAVWSGTTLNQTGQAVEIILMTMAVYLTISLLISAFMNWYNNRKALVER